MKLTTAGPDPTGPPVPSMNGLPPEVLMIIYLHVDSAADMYPLSRTCQSMHSLALDPHLTAQWFLKYQPTKAMWLAAQKMRSTDIMLQLLHLGASPLARHCSNSVYVTYTPLEMAALWGHPKVVEVLLQNHDVQASVSDAVDALYFAIESGNIECLKALLVPPSPAHANSRDCSGYHCSRFSPLHAAALCPNRKAPLAAKVLIEHGGACAACDPDGQAPLHYAGASGSVPIVRLLLDTLEGPSLLCLRDRSGQTPLHKACGPSAHFEVVRTLLDAPGGLLALAVRDGQGKTPLHVACGSGAPSWVIDCLLGTPGGPSALSTPDFHGQTPLHIACGSASSRVVHILLNAPGAVDIASCVAACDHRGQTPLHVACSSMCFAPFNQVKAVHALFSVPGGQALVDAVDNGGRTPLRLAAGSAVECCEVLLHAGFGVFQGLCHRLLLVVSSCVFGFA
ncbi:ankyrin repeat-containing domain protein [Dunaliella salina]|uniref:Ankyrin repeat-containing domain protein n=1 Tax=Dunaliella salina TaxID=3046 RepID=A0ABQ7G4B7_DUNSA|nr:ankyrin repeat-containing domain protein [Dunaliella salina]|eukprot:KAF5829435.1 ankyrin repeat-containing domain protein [Dunaliella salina]